jgi:ATP-dependent Clp protease adaptor protein ClpS
MTANGRVRLTGEVRSMRGGGHATWASTTPPSGRGRDRRHDRAGELEAINVPLAQTAPTAPAEIHRPIPDEVMEIDVPWIVIVWNDPINLMSYVTWVFQKLFGYPRSKAEKLMMDVHTKGKAVVSGGSREKAESDVARLHAHGLWATMQKET